MFGDPGLWVLSAIGVGLILLAGTVLLKDPTRGVNRALAALSALAATWISVAYLEDSVASLGVAKFLVAADFATAILMCAAFATFSLCFAFKRLSGALLAGPWILAITLSALSYVGSGLLSNVERQPDGLHFDTGPLFLVYAASVLLLILIGIASLTYQVWRSRGAERVQGQFVLLGLFLSSVMIATTNLILPRLIDTPSAVSRIGSYSIVIFLGTTVYAIIRHRLMDIRLVVARSLAYFLLLTILGSGYVGALYLLQAQLLHQRAGSGQIVSSAILALLVALTAEPLRHLLEKATDRIFFRDRYDTGELLGRLSRLVSSTIILDTLTQRVLSEVIAKLHLQGGAMLVRDREEGLLIQNQKLLTQRLALTDLDDLFHHHSLTVFDDLPEGRRKAFLRGLGVSVAVPIESRDGIIGLILLGAKKSGNPYSEGDLEVLEILAPELSVGIENARAYHQIERFNETLRLKVDRATRKLREANAHLRELDKAKDEFISLASHQLRTPLTAIKGYLSMVKDGDAGKLSARQSEFISVAADGAERMAMLIDDLLNVSRMDAGRFIIDRTPTKLSEMVEQEVRELTPHADARHLELIYRPSKAWIPELLLDATKTRQVVINFIDNAIYYTKEGSVEITLEKVGESVEFRVKDTGIGISPKDQARLFVKFYRAENARDVRPDGTGLGLYLAKRVVEQQGGEVIFESELGHGSTFGFRFPIPKAEHRKVSPAKVPTHQRRRARTSV